MKLLHLALSLLSLAPLSQAQAQELSAHTSDQIEVSKDGVQTVLYDIQDLIQDRLTDGLAGDLNSKRLAATQEFVDVLRSVIDGSKRGLVSMEGLADGRFQVKGAAATHEYVVDFLSAQRRSTKGVSLTMLLLEMPAGHLKKLGLNESSAIFNGEVECADFLQRVRADGEVDVMSTPAVSFRPRSTAYISTTNEVSYIADYILQIVEPGNTEILDPVIGVVEEGVAINVRAVPVPGGVFQFDLEINYSMLQRPIPMVKTRIQSGDGPEVEISLPIVDKISLNSVLALTEGSAALISSASPAKDRDFAILVKFPKTQGPLNQRVSNLFDEMRVGTYSHRWFPPLEWEDIPALLEMAWSPRLLKTFPTNPLSSQSITTCREGVIALWLIEGILEGGNLPSLNPILLQEGSGLAPLDALSDEQQRKLLESARVAYGSWWKIVSENRNRAKSALTDTGLRWY